MLSALSRKTRVSRSERESDQGHVDFVDEIDVYALFAMSSYDLYQRLLASLAFDWISLEQYGSATSDSSFQGHISFIGP